ncbi:MAG: alpha/beta fold hydrolase [Gemmatimonadetes bacterium]|nr:alpha/beta fold hydrolase [Gemmatimonadota bacterium]
MIGRAALVWCALLALAVRPATAAQERVPLLLVPGWHDSASELGELRRRLLADGWSGSAVMAVDFSDRYGSNVAHATELASVVDALLAVTGAGQVDVVAHSMGGLAVRYYLRFLGGAAKVRRVVFLATPHRGTYAAYLAWGAGGDEMEPGSEFLQRLNDGEPVPPGIRVTTIRTPLDLRMFPPESALLAGATNLEVCCPTHPGLLRDAGTFALIRQALLEP